MKKILLVCFGILLNFILTGCCREHISAQTTFLNRTELASYYVETPDPQLNYPLIGQRLYISWNLPPSYFDYRDLHLKITIRFGDRSECVKTVPICNRSNYYLYVLYGQEFIEKEGILTYKIDLIGDDRVIESRHHQLWVDLITIGS